MPLIEKDRVLADDQPTKAIQQSLGVDMIAGRGSWRDREIKAGSWRTRSAPPTGENTQRIGAWRGAAATTR